MAHTEVHVPRDNDQLLFTLDSAQTDRKRTEASCLNDRRFKVAQADLLSNASDSSSREGKVRPGGL